MNKASYNAISDPFEQMLSRIQERKLRKMIAEDNMAQITEKERLRMEALAQERIADQAQKEEDLKRELGLETVVDESIPGVKRTFKRAAGSGEAQAPAVSKFQKTMADRAAGAAAGSGVSSTGSEQVKAPSRSLAGLDPLGSAGRAINKMGGPVDMSGMEFASPDTWFSKTNIGAEAAREDSQLSKMTPEQLALYVEQVNRNKKQAPATTIQAAPLTPEEMKQLEDEKKQQEIIDAIKMQNSA